MLYSQAPTAIKTMCSLSTGGETPTEGRPTPGCWWAMEGRAMSLARKLSPLLTAYRQKGGGRGVKPEGRMELDETRAALNTRHGTQAMGNVGGPI